MDNEWHKEEAEDLLTELGIFVSPIAGARLEVRRTRDHASHSEIVKLRAKGLSYGKIGLELDVNKGTAHQEVKKHQPQKCGCFD